MELDLEHQYADRAYAILTNLVTPRPIALVTTISPDGKVNAAPFSFFNVLGANPPLVAFSPADREPGVPKDTALNVRATHEFVINLVDAGIQEGMNQCAAPLPYGENELVRAKLTPTPSQVVKPPRIAEAPASLECVEWGTLQIGGNRVVLGIVKHIHIKDEYFDAEKKRVLGDKIFLIGRMASPNWYCTTKERFELERPS